MQYLTLTKSLKELHTLKKLKYSQSLFDQSSFESLKISLSRQLSVIRPNPVQSMPFLPQIDPIQSNPIQSMDESNPCPTLMRHHSCAIDRLFKSEMLLLRIQKHFVGNVYIFVEDHMHFHAICIRGYYFRRPASNLCLLRRLLCARLSGSTKACRVSRAIGSATR